MRKLFKCKHDWRFTEKSNILQVDDMGYPLRLYIEKCCKCGESRQSWIDVPTYHLDELKTGESVLLRWTPVSYEGGI